MYSATCEVKWLSRVRLFETPWTVACTRLLHPSDFPGKSTGVGCHFLLQGIFPTQGSNPGLLNCRQTLHHLSHQGRVKRGKWFCCLGFVLFFFSNLVSYPLSSPKISSTLYLPETCQRPGFVWSDCVSLRPGGNRLLWPPVPRLCPGSGKYSFDSLHDGLGNHRSAITRNW